MRRASVVRNALALAVCAMGTIDVVSALLSHPPERLLGLERLLPTSVLDTSRTFTLIAGVLLLVAAWGLRRGKRRAFVFALLLCAVSVPFNVLKALDVEEATVAAFLLFVLGVSGDAFRVKSRELSWRGWGVFALLVGAVLVLAASVGAWVVSRRYGGGATPADAFAAAVQGLVGLGPDVALPHPTDTGTAARTARWFAGALPALGVLYASGVGLLALQPAQHRRRHEADRRRLEAIAESAGEDGLAPFVGAGDLDAFLSANGRAAIAYRAESDVLLALGDPVGPAEERAPLLDAFETYCVERDWEFAFFQARPEALPEYTRRGWRAIHIGEEPVLDPARFTLEGGAMGDVRRAVHRLEGQGIEVLSFRPPEHAFDPEAGGGALLAGLRAVSREWLDAHPGGEKSFGMGRFDPRTLGQSWLVVARAKDGTVEAFATWAPVPAAHAYALDLTRRRRAAPPGVMDLLIARSALESGARGDAWLSLGLSALARVGETPDPEFERVREALRRRLGRFYDFDGLFQWKKKFQPRFEDRFLVVRGTLALPRVLYALARAQTPGGFLAAWRASHPKSPPTEVT